MPLVMLAADRAHAQPSVELPPPGPLSGPTTRLTRETPVENALGGAAPMEGSAIGGSEELTLNVPDKFGLDPSDHAVVDLRRFVLFFGHNFTDRLRFYSELEVEHAVSSSEDRGEAEVEQAYLDALISRRLSLRGGLIIIRRSTPYELNVELGRAPRLTMGAMSYASFARAPLMPSSVQKTYRLRTAGG